MKYIGIDLAWSSKNETGICIFEDKRCIYLASEVFSNDDICKLINEHQPCVVSVDAPLVVQNETGGRKVDSALMKTKIHGQHLKLYATSRSYMLRVFGEIRGEELLDKVHLTLGENIVETYPTGVFLSLFPKDFKSKYKLSSKLSLDDLIVNSQLMMNNIKSLGFDFNLSFIGKTKKAYKHYEDQLDGILCAVNSYYVYHKQAYVFFDDNGVITLPKT